MGSLRHLYRWNFVAKQIGWKRAPSIDLPPTASNRAPLVARRHAYRLQWCETGGTLQDLRYPCRRRSPGTAFVREKRARSKLVERRKRANVRRIADGRPEVGENHVVGSENARPDPVGGLTGNLLPALVTGWPLRSSPQRRQPEINAFGFVYAKVAPAGRQDGNPWLHDLVAGQQIHRF